MVTKSLKLRFLLLKAAFRGGFWQILGTVLMHLLTLTGVALAAVAPILWADRLPIALPVVQTLAGVLLLVIVTLLAFFNSAKALTANQFSGYGYSYKTLALGIFCSQLLLSRVGFVLFVYVVAQTAAAMVTGSYTPAILGSGIVFYVLAHLLYACFTTLAQLLFSRWLSALWAKWLGFTAVSCCSMLLLVSGWQLFFAKSAAVAAAFTWLQHLPGGLWIALLAFNPQVAVGSLLLTGVLWLLLAVVYLQATKTLVTTLARPDPLRKNDAGLGWFAYFTATPGGVIAARTLTYWRRDPRYVVNAVVLPVAAAAATAALHVAGVQPAVLALVPVPIMLYLWGWSIHNDVAMDSTAIWMHVASGVSGRADRLGRLIPILVVAAPVLIAGTVVSVLIAGNLQLLPVVFGLNLVILLSAAGVSTLANVLAAYPSTRPGDSPFIQPQYTETRPALVQSVSFISGILVATPAIVCAIMVLTTQQTLLVGFISLMVSVINGVGVLLLCIHYGGKVFAAKGPELVQLAEVFD